MLDGFTWDGFMLGGFIRDKFMKGVLGRVENGKKILSAGADTKFCGLSSTGPTLAPLTSPYTYMTYLINVG